MNTSVSLLGEPAGIFFIYFFFLTAKAYGQQEETGLILSCSLDCSIKLWALKSGHLLKSIYTFNGIISMSYIRGRRLTVTGYTGGKIELWDILSGESIFSIIGHGEAVTALMVIN